MVRGGEGRGEMYMLKPLRKALLTAAMVAMMVKVGSFMLMGVINDD